MLAFINPQQPIGKAQYTSARDKSKQLKFANVIVTNNQPKGPNPFNLAQKPIMREEIRPSRHIDIKDASMDVRIPNLGAWIDELIWLARIGLTLMVLMV